MIMDGNKRWSDINKVTLKKGYQKGLDKIKEIISICLEEMVRNQERARDREMEREAD